MTSHEESRIQQACIRGFRYEHPKVVLFAIPNGGARTGLQGSILKGEGVLAGVADLFLMKANSKFHGLFIEMKTAKGVQSDTQKQFEAGALAAGYDYKICRSSLEFQLTVNKYLTT